MTIGEILRNAGLLLVATVPAWAFVAALNSIRAAQRRSFMPLIVPVAAGGASILLGAGLFLLGVVVELAVGLAPADLGLYLVVPCLWIVLGLGLAWWISRAVRARDRGRRRE